VGIDVGDLACYLYRPMVYGRQTRGQSFLSGVALSHHVAVGGGAFSGGGGGAKPPGLDISCSVDHLGTCVTESYMEKHAFTRVCLFYIRVTMVIMCVFMVELLCQTSMG
jgi:hypothetical protein